MIKYELVTGFPGAMDAADHHAPTAMPFIEAFLVHLPGTLGTTDDVWLVRQSRRGGRSWAIHAPDGTAYHLRPEGYDGPDSKPYVVVLDAYRNGTERLRLSAPDQVRPFLKKIEWAYQQGRPLWAFFGGERRAA